MKKKCTNCGNTKDISRFSWKNKSKGIRRSQCKECRNRYHKKRYKNNPKVRERLRNAKVERRENGREFINRYKKFCCCKNCDEDRWYVLQFHHNNEEDKIVEVSRMAGQGYSIEAIKEEIRKCDILCANCHIEYHFLNN